MKGGKTSHCDSNRVLTVSVKGGNLRFLHLENWGFAKCAVRGNGGQNTSLNEKSLYEKICLKKHCREGATMLKETQTAGLRKTHRGSVRQSLYKPQWAGGAKKERKEREAR